MLLLSIFLPLFSAIASGFFGRRLGHYGVQIIAVAALALSLLIVLSGSHISETVNYYSLYNWCTVGQFSVEIEFLFNNVTNVMLIVVLSISLIVHLYSTQYLATDPHLPRFLAYLSFFTFFMLILVSAENLIQLFLGWEGVGLCSYLLINFWYTRIQAGKSALKAVFVNKIGDISMLFGISLTFIVFKTTAFTTIFALVPYVQELELFFFTHYNAITVIALCFLIGAVGKSAQIGLHVWLPDAMEGPTPVSALLHAATMVTAGIFLIIRTSFLFEHAPTILVGCLFMGALTAFFAATTGLLQNDLKRIIAFSTCSQLGYMLVACGLSQYSLSLFHLFNHAFFKALLFLAAGSVIHALNDEQDIRKMGGLSRFLPLTSTFFFIASLSLMGFPFLSGFYSKDLILENAWISSQLGHSYSFWFLLFAAFFTAAYSTRLMFYVFLTRPNFFRTNLHTIADSNAIVQIPLIVLCLASIFSGYLFADKFVGFGTTFFNHALDVLPGHSFGIDLDWISPVVKQLPFLMTIAGALCSILFVKLIDTNLFLSSSIVYYVCCFLNHKWFFDKLYNVILTRLVKKTYYHFFAYLDKGIIELVGPSGFAKGVLGIAQLLKNLQKGHISSYFFVVFSSLAVLMLTLQYIFV